MDTLPYLLPWILLLLAAATVAAVKLLDIKSIVGIAVLASLSLLMILVAVYANVVSSQQAGLVQQKQEQLATMEQWKYRHLDELSLIIAQMKPPSDDAQELLRTLISFGWKMNNSKIQQAKLADSALQRVKAEWEPELPILIKGIPSTVDYEIVDLSLRQVGFTVIPFREDETPEEEVNIIYYGRDVTLVEIKLAALVLMRAGVELKAIKPFPKATKGNIRALKIEWNKYYLSRKALEVESVETAQSFK